jgi:hypothetical protein
MISNVLYEVVTILENICILLLTYDYPLEYVYLYNYYKHMIIH